MNIDQYKSKFDDFLQSVGNEPAEFRQQRKDAFTKFLKMGYPTKNNENWRYANLTSLEKTEYRLPIQEKSKVVKSLIEQHFLNNCHRIVIVNGKFDINLSPIEDISAIVTIHDISATNPDVFISSNNPYANPFMYLNKAFSSGGYYIEISPNYITDKPIHLLNIISDENENIQQHHHNLIKIGDNSQISIIEENLNLSRKEVFRNSVCKIEIGREALLSHNVLQLKSFKSKIINNLSIEQSENSSYKSQKINIGNDLIRNDLHVQINGENCTTDISDLSLLSSNNHVENYVVVNHNKPNSYSSQLFKYILDDSSEGVFNGIIKVQPDAQKTDAQQTNKNIILSKNALMNSNPQLEINADEVTCSHGSATGQLDNDIIFYLRSRGIDLAAAKSLLIEGFAREVIDKITNDTIKEKLILGLHRWLAK